MRLDRRNMDKLVGRYMQEIRDIVKAGLSRRELLRMGLVSGSSGLLALYGMRNFKPYWGHALLFAKELQLHSPPNTPFQDPLPIPREVQQTILDPAPTEGTNPDASNTVASKKVPGFKNPFPEASRDFHQRWTEFGGTAAGFTGPQYELIEQEVEHDFYPAQDRVPSSPVWTFVDAH